MAITAACASNAWAVDFESFEFNDPAGTKLAGAANTANPGNNWFEGTGMGASDIRGGNFNIVKDNTGLAQNYLQIDNITSGTRYLVARMSGWNFFDDGGPTEEVRFAFLNDDTGVSGSTITAQMNIRRLPDTRQIALVGTALPAGTATDIPGAVILNETQTNPFTIVLELNKTSNSYKVFYKDGTNPTQVLGLGSVAPARGGNSIRFAVNNNIGAFSLDYPFEPAFEFVAIDRIALTDTNPFTDLISLEVDRTSAQMTLRNTSGATISGIQSYSITSAAGGLNPAGWSPGAATPTSATNFELAASFATPINLANGATLALSVGDGAWLKSPFEDLQMVLQLSGGATRTVNVNFLGNGGLKWMMGDFNFNNSLDPNDWLHFIAHAETDIASLSRVAAYQRGDLTGDGQNSIADFLQFKALYDAANGAGAFAAMIESLNVPEPSGALLLAAAALLLAVRRNRRVHRTQRSPHDSPSFTSDDNLPSLGVPHMRSFFNVLAPLAVTAALAAITPTAHSAVLEDFQFNDPNGTLLGEAANSANPTNTWLVHANTVESEVFNGSFRIQKHSQTAQASNVLDIANITTGKAWLVAELAGWNYTATPSSPSERVRFAFLDNDNPTTGSSTITAEANIDRGGGGLLLRGEALGTGATNPLPNTYPLPLVRTDPFTIALELDKDANQYSIYYKDHTAPFALLGTGNLGQKIGSTAIREGNSIRFAFTGTFGEPGEFFDVGRIYLTNESPIIGPVDPTTLVLDVQSNGLVSIRNSTPSPITFNSYRITSPTADLNFAGWNSLSDQGIDAIGPGPGQSWDEAGGSSDSVLAESFLLGSSTIAPNNGLSLGSAFKPGGNHELLTFQYHDMNTGTIVTGDVNFVTAAGINGDYTNDGVVDARDFVLWRKNVGTTNTLPNDPTGGTIGEAQYNTWRANFGLSATSGSGLANAAPIPEPTALGLASLASVLWAGCRNRRRSGTRPPSRR